MPTILICCEYIKAQLYLNWQIANNLFDWLVQNGNISSALTMEILPSCTKPSIWRDGVLLQVGDSPAVLGVVHYGQHPTAKELLRQAARLPQGQGRQIIWFMSEAVGRETDLYTGHEDLARNVITITPAYHEVRLICRWSVLLQGNRSDTLGEQVWGNPYLFPSNSNKPWVCIVLKRALKQSPGRITVQPVSVMLYFLSA